MNSKTSSVKLTFVVIVAEQQKWVPSSMSKSSRRRSSPTWSASFSVCAAGKYVTTPNDYHKHAKHPETKYIKKNFQYVLCGRGRMRSRQWELKLFFRSRFSFSTLFLLSSVATSIFGQDLCVCVRLGNCLPFSHHAVPFSLPVKRH